MIFDSSSIIINISCSISYGSSSSNHNNRE